MLNSQGAEINDPKPLTMPVGCRKPESLKNQIQRLIKGQISTDAQEAGHESFKESQDFDIEDEFEKSERESQYQLMDEEFLTKLPEDSDNIEPEKEIEPERENSISETPPEEKK